MWVTQVPTQFTMSPGNLAACDSTYFSQCIYFHDIRWAVWTLATALPAGNAITAPITVAQMPLGVPRGDVAFMSYAFVSRLYAGRITNAVPLALWVSAQAPITAQALQVVGSTAKLTQGHVHLDVVVAFTVPRPVLTNGSIEIRFATNVSQVYAHCHSLIYDA
jgi:hypothetical protein